MADCIPAVLLDGSEGSMIELAESLTLKRFKKRHNDPDDPYLLQPHEVVCFAYQFKNGVQFLHTSTQHMLNNPGRGENCG